MRMAHPGLSVPISTGLGGVQPVAARRPQRGRAGGAEPGHLRHATLAEYLASARVASDFGYSVTFLVATATLVRRPVQPSTTASEDKSSYRSTDGHVTPGGIASALDRGGC